MALGELRTLFVEGTYDHRRTRERERAHHVSISDGVLRVVAALSRRRLWSLRLGHPSPSSFIKASELSNVHKT